MSKPVQSVDFITNFLKNSGNFLFLYIFKRWIAGSKAKDAVEYVRKLNRLETASMGLINYMGEHYKDKKEAIATLQEYKKLIDRIHESKINSSLTIKVSQLGFDANNAKDAKRFCFSNLQEIIKHAKQNVKKQLKFGMN